MDDALSDLNKPLFEMHDDLSDDIDGNVAVAKQYYSKVADTRKRIENQLRKDMLELYDVKGFLKKKRKSETIKYHVKKRQ